MLLNSPTCFLAKGLISCFLPSATQLRCGKVMFSQASVILSMGGVWQTPLGRQSMGRHPHGQIPPLGRHSPGRHPRQTPPWVDTTSLPGQTPPLGRHNPLGRHPPPQQTVRILLELKSVMLIERYCVQKQSIRLATQQIRLHTRHTFVTILSGMVYPLLHPVNMVFKLPTETFP